MAQFVPGGELVHHRRRLRLERRTRELLMRACVLHGVKRLEVREVPTPEPGPRDVLVRVQAVGVCATDLHIYAGESNYNTDERGQPIPLDRQPQIPGHEIAGEVVAAGAEVEDLRPGNRVAVDQGLNCISRSRETLCEYCVSGDSHQCESYTELGITGPPGGLAELVAVPAVNAVALASDLEPVQAALTEPLACIVHAMDIALRVNARYRLQDPQRARRVSSVLVLGAGPAGLLFTQYLRRVLAFDGRVIVSEPNAHKRALAEQFGAEVLDPGDVDVIAAVRERTEGRLAELILECTGSAAVYPVLPGLLRKQGTAILYGHGRSGVDLSVLNGLQFREPFLLSPVGGSGGFDDDGRPSVYRRALRLLEAGTVQVAPLVSHRYRALEDVETALSRDFHEPDYSKGVVEPS